MAEESEKRSIMHAIVVTIGDKKIIQLQANKVQINEAITENSMDNFLAQYYHSQI